MVNWLLSSPREHKVTQAARHVICSTHGDCNAIIIKHCLHLYFPHFFAHTVRKTQILQHRMGSVLQMWLSTHLFEVNIPI